VNNFATKILFMLKVPLERKPLKTTFLSKIKSFSAKEFLLCNQQKALIKANCIHRKAMTVQRLSIAK
jgi:hypothetical protein